MHRHPELPLRSPDQISFNRAKGFNAAAVNNFFENLGAILDTGKFTPETEWNMDETACTTKPTKPIKVVARKGINRVGQKTSAERGTTVSLALAINAMGHRIPPFYIFPRTNMQRIFMDGASYGSVGHATESGWMNSATFLKFLDQFIMHLHASPDKPALLILDGHASHLNIEVLDKATEKGITMISLPPHCSHRLQPLDVGVFGAFKEMYNDQFQAWMKNHMDRVIELHHIPPIVDKCMDKTVTQHHIKQGFKLTNNFTEADFFAAELSGENESIEEDENDGTRRVTVLSADDIETAAHVEVTTSASEATTSGLSAASLVRALQQVSPLQTQGKKKKSTRGRKPMASSILTSPENVEISRKKAMEKRTKQAKTATKKAKPVKNDKKKPEKSEAPSKKEEKEEGDKCLICKTGWTAKQTKNNTIHCNDCDRPAHLKCAVVSTAGFTCDDCEAL